MGFQIIKEKVYANIPSFLKKYAKSFFYDIVLFSKYSLKYRILYKKWDFFDSIALETTTHCNLRCKFCPNNKYARGSKKNEKLMSEKLFKKIIDELAEVRYKGQILFHFYGEPLTDKRLPELVDYTNKKLPYANMQLNTNGFLLSIPIYNELVSKGIKVFFITQYSNSMPPKIKELFSYLESHLDVENKILYRVLGEDLPLSNRGGEIPVEKNIDFDRPICLHPRNAVNVDFNGNVLLCCNDYHSSIKFGNLEKEKIIDIWEKPIYKNFRRQLKKKQFVLPICKKCVGLN